MPVGTAATVKAVYTDQLEAAGTDVVLGNTYHLHLSRVIQRKLVMGVANGSVWVDGREIYTATDLKVGLFRDSEPQPNGA